MAGLTVTKLHPSLGAEIAGIDLSQPIDGAAREALSQALAEHLALVFRNQRLTPPQVPGGGIGFRSADAAALFATQHAGLPGCRTGLAPQRPTAG